MLAERSAQLGAPADVPPGPPEPYEPLPAEPDPAEPVGPAGPGAEPWAPSQGGEAEAGRHGTRVREWRRGRPRSCRNAGLEVGRDGWYVVDDGDTLWSIAEVHYGYGGAYRRILRANRERIWDPSLIHPCQRVFIPVW